MGLLFAGNHFKARQDMKQLPAEEFELRSEAGDAVCSEITDFLMGDIESDDQGRFRRLYLSMIKIKNQSVGTPMVLWHVISARGLRFTVEGCRYDSTTKESKIEGMWRAA